MSPTDLRRKNLAVLLEGKGAKSALARLISLSPASVTSMLNGTKPLDKEFCNSLCHALKLPENWFETERKTGDVPEAVQKRLAPLPRGSATPTPVLNKSGTAAPSAPAAAPAAPAAHAAPAPQTATPAASMPQTWPSTPGGSKVSKILRLGTGAAAPAPAATPAAVPEAASTPPAVEAAPAAAPAAASTPHTKAATPAVSRAPTAPARALPAAQAGDTLPGPVSGFLVEGGLSPITEALIKTLDQKARQGVLSEDRAFELLGSVRAL